MVDKQVVEASRLLCKRLKAKMAQQKLKHQQSFAEYLGIPKSTLHNYLSSKVKGLPKPSMLQQLREKIPEITDEDAKCIEVAYSRKASLSRSSKTETRQGKSQSKVRAKSSETSRQVMPQSDDRDAFIGRLVRQLLTEVAQNGCVETTTSDPIALLSTHAETRYRVGDMFSVLTKENFETLDVSTWSETEQQHFLGYANLVLEESRKCMLLLAQFESDQIREEFLERLARNADLLWRTYKAASSVAPIEYVKDIELAHKCERL